MDIDDAWRRVETWLAAKAPDVLSSLLPGATEGDIARLESSIGARLPADFRDSLCRHEGQADDDAGGLFPYSNSVGPAPAWRLMPLAQIEWVRAQLNGLVEVGQFAGRKADLAAGEQTDWWPAGWVPIADDGGGDHACLDLSGGSDAARVVQFRHDSPRRKVFAPSFGAWLKTLADELEAGRYHFDPDEWGLVEPEEDEE